MLTIMRIKSIYIILIYILFASTLFAEENCSTEKTQELQTYFQNVLYPQKTGLLYYVKAFTGAHPWVRARFLVNHPGWHARVIATGFKTFFLDAEIRQDFQKRTGVSLPVYTSIEVSNICDLRCATCYVKRSSPVVLGKEKFQRIIDSSKALGIHSFVLFGGEPFHPRTRDTVLEIAAKNKDVVFLVCTNGNFIDQQLADSIKKAGNMFLLVSIDGLEKTNDAIRGVGTFDKIQQTLSLLRSRNVLYGTSVTLTSRNIEEVTSAPFIDYLVKAEALVIYYHKFMTSDPNSQLLPTTGSYYESARRLQQMAREKHIIIYHGEYGNMYQPRLLLKENNYVYVDSSGMVFLERQGIPLGNINEHSFEELLSSDKVKKLQLLKRTRGTINNNPGFSSDEEH
jgi:MoaA/NifB/PqqE/SkfB family radical SAM enzyme